MKITGIRKGSPIWWIGVLIGASLVVAYIVWMMAALIIIS